MARRASQGRARGGFDVTGADDLFRLSKALKDAGETGKGSLLAELNKQLRAGVKPLIKEARDAARTDLPRRGGLAASIAKQPLRAVPKAGRSSNTANVSIQRPGNFVSSRTMNDQGINRHPVFATKYRVPAQSGKAKTKSIFANSSKPGGVTFISQSLPATRGWFDRRMEREGPKVRPFLEQAIKSVSDEVARRARG